MGGVEPTVKDVFLTLLRWCLGLTVGAFLGLVIALIEALIIRIKFKTANRLIGATLDFMRSLPIIALVPLIQLWAIDEWWKIGLISWAVMFPVWLSVKHANLTRLIDTELALSASGLTATEILLRYQLPKALGGLVKGIEIAIGIGWISVVAGEWVGTFTKGFWAGGLGYKVQQAHDANNWAGMLACLGLFGLLGLSSAWIWRKLSSVIWRITPGFDPLRGYGD